MCVLYYVLFVFHMFLYCICVLYCMLCVCDICCMCYVCDVLCFVLCYMLYCDVSCIHVCACVLYMCDVCCIFMYVVCVCIVLCTCSYVLYVCVVFLYIVYACIMCVVYACVLYVCAVYMWVLALQDTEVRAFRNQVSSSIMWVLKIGLRFSGLELKHLSPLGGLACSALIVSVAPMRGRYCNTATKWSGSILTTP